MQPWSWFFNGRFMFWIVQQLPGLGPPLVPFCPFLGEGSRNPTKIDVLNKGTLILASLLADLPGSTKPLVLVIPGPSRSISSRFDAQRSSLRISVVQWHPFSLFFGGCPTKNGLPQKGSFFSRVTEQLRNVLLPFGSRAPFGHWRKTWCADASASHWQQGR